MTCPHSWCNRLVLDYWTVIECVQHVTDGGHAVPAKWQRVNKQDWQHDAVQLGSLQSKCLAVSRYTASVTLFVPTTTARRSLRSVSGDSQINAPHRYVLMSFAEFYPRGPLGVGKSQVGQHCFISSSVVLPADLQCTTQLCACAPVSQKYVTRWLRATAPWMLWRHSASLHSSAPADRRNITLLMHLIKWRCSSRRS